MVERGDELFCSLFEETHHGMQLWTMIQPHLNATRVEITTDISEATAIPWELIRNPHTGTFLALSVASFVRTQRESRIRIAPGGEAEKVRILLVICRPHGGEDVPFRSVASRLVTRLSDEVRDACCVRRPTNDWPRRWGGPESVDGPITSFISMAMAFMPMKKASPRRERFSII